MSDVVEQIAHELSEQFETFKSIESIINPTKLKKEVAGLEAQFSDPDVFQNPSRMNQINKELHQKKKDLNQYLGLSKSHEDLLFAIELYQSESDSSLIPEIIKNHTEFQDLLKKANLKFLLNGEMDINSAILTIHPGAGGTESCDWASILHRMYLRWAEQYGFKAKELDFLPGEVAGIKSVTLLIEGDYAYGYLRSEMGVHRLVRISPFDSSARRHTSFASVEVAPEVDEEINIEILDKDLRVDTFCSSGAGGQSVNTTYSAVRLTHYPSGLVVSCQNEKSQIMNKAMAMKVLKSRLMQLEIKRKQEEREKAMGIKMDIGWGSQIRSYVLHPYQLVKDHRTGCSTSSTDKVLDGDLEDFILSYLQWDGQPAGDEEI
ncbi:MAG: peptide chain release factor 2 [Candidatus Cloacimonetes bacterium]|nr:peptide chain release factor 2 [Candidatus Cloacimonadota bacterium]